MIWILSSDNHFFLVVSIFFLLFGYFTILFVCLCISNTTFQLQFATEANRAIISYFVLGKNTKLKKKMKEYKFLQKGDNIREKFLQICPVKLLLPYIYI